MLHYGIHTYIVAGVAAANKLAPLSPCMGTELAYARIAFLHAPFHAFLPIHALPDAAAHSCNASLTYKECE